jgi:hypothetical protein
VRRLGATDAALACKAVAALKGGPVSEAYMRGVLADPAHMLFIASALACALELAHHDCMRKDEGEPEAQRRGARIDNSLAESHEARQKVRRLLASATAAADISTDGVRKLRDSILKLSPAAIPALLDLYLAGGRDERDLAFLVLTSMPGKALAPHISNLAKSPRTTKEQRVQLVALTAFEADRQEDLEQATEAVGAQLSDLVGLFASMVADKLEPEETALMYLQDFADQPENDRLLFLQFLIDEALPEFLPILEIESRNPDFRVRMAVARGLARFPFKETLYTAEFLLNDTSPAVRYDAQRAMEELQRRGALEYHVPPPPFHRACCFVEPEHGAATLFYAARSARGRIKFFAMLLDFWTKGVVEAWGNVGLSDQDFDGVIEEFLGDARKHGMHGQLERYELTREQALHLFLRALEFTSQQGAAPPLELFLFDRLVRDENFSGVDDEELEIFTFGASCVGCEKELHPNRSRSNVVPLGSSDLLCRKCAGVQRACSECGARFRVKDVQLPMRGACYSFGKCRSCLEREGIGGAKRTS